MRARKPSFSHVKRGQLARRNFPAPGQPHPASYFEQADASADTWASEKSRNAKFMVAEAVRT